MNFISRDLYDIETIAISILNQFITVPSIIFLNGPMGIGKTTLASLMIKKLNGHESSSSSYGIVNIYPGKPSIIHCDFYRTNWCEDFYESEISPHLTNNSVLFIEWVKPHILDTFINTISIELSPDKQNTRRIKACLCN